MEKQVQVGTSIVIINKKLQILVGKRKGSHGEGLWSLPGGHLEYGEKFTTCCDRELYEEIGITFGKYKPIGFSEDFFNGKHYATLYFLVKDVDSNINIKNTEPEKCEGWKWFHIDNISTIKDDMFCDSYNQIMKLFEKVNYKETYNSEICVNLSKWILKQ